MSVSLQAIVSLDKSGFSSGLSGMSQLVGNLTGAMSMAFGGVASEILAMSRAFGPVGAATVVLKEAITVGAGFEQQMANVASVSGLVGDEMKKVEEATRDMARTTRFTATQTGDAMYSLASAGVTGAEALSNTLKPALLLAGATLSSTQMATEAMTAALANFRIPAEEATRVADQFAGAIATSPATMERLSEAMQYAGPAAAGFGISMEKAVAEVAAFHQIGLRGEMAGTSFRMALVQMSEELGKSGSKVGAALQGWNAATEGITGAVRRLEASGIDTAVVIGELGARAGPGIAAMMKFGADAMDNLAARVANAADVSKMYDTQMATLSGRFAIFKSAMEEVSLKIFNSIAPSLTRMVEGLTAAADWVGKLASALFAGDWDKARGQIAALWDAIRAGVRAFDWVGLIERAKDLFSDLAGTAGAFLSRMAEQIGLTRTIGAVRDAIDTLKTSFGTLWDTAKRLFETFADDGPGILTAAVKLLDFALAATVRTLDLALRAVNGLIAGWKSLSDGTQVVILAIAGTAGLVVGLVRLVAMIEATTKATIAFAAAQKLHLVSAAETAYIKLLLLVDGFKAVTLAQAGMVVGAAALGVAVGTIIRKIPGVADALDGMITKIGEWLGLVATQDKAIEENYQKWKKLREEQNARIAAAPAQVQASTEITEATRLEVAEAKRLNEEYRRQQELADSLVPLTDDVADAHAGAARSAAGFTAGLRAADEELARAYIGMRTFVPASALVESALAGMGESAAEASGGVGELADETEAAKVSITDLFGMLSEWKDKKISAFDVSAFVDSMKRLAAGLAGVNLPEIRLPDFSKVNIPRLNALETSSFVQAIKQLAAGLSGVVMPDMSNLLDLAFIELPRLTRSEVSTFLASLGQLKAGMMKLDFGSLGRMDIDIKGGAESAAVSRLDAILQRIDGMRGVVWT